MPRNLKWLFVEMKNLLNYDERGKLKEVLSFESGYNRNFCRFMFDVKENTTTYLKIHLKHCFP